MLGSLFSSMANFASNESTNSTNERIARENAQIQRETNAMNERIANRNFQIQEATNLQNQKNWQANFDYQKALQQQVFDREDSSYARTVQDMRNSGLSPLMMSGTNQAGQAIQTTPFEATAPHNDFQAVAPTVDFQAKPFLGFDLGDPITSGFALVDKMYNIEAEKQKIKSMQLQNENMSLQNKFFSEDYQNKIATSIAERILKENQSSDSSRNEAFNKSFNISNDMPEKVKVAKIAAQIAYDDVPDSVVSPKVKEGITGNTKDFNPDDPYDSFFSQIPLLGGIFRRARDWSRSKIKQDNKKVRK